MYVGGCPRDLSAPCPLGWSSSGVETCAQPVASMCLHEQRPFMHRVDASLQVTMTADVVKRAALLTKNPSLGNAAPHGHARRHAQSLTTNAQRCLPYV